MGDLEKIWVLKAEITAAEGIISIANRHADLAEQMAGECKDEVRKAELLKIAEGEPRCLSIRHRTSRELYSLCSPMNMPSIWSRMLCLYNLGRIDQYLLPIMKRI